MGDSSVPNNRPALGWATFVWMQSICSQSINPYPLYAKQLCCCSFACNALIRLYHIVITCNPLYAPHMLVSNGYGLLGHAWLVFCCVVQRLLVLRRYGLYLLVTLGPATPTPPSRTEQTNANIGTFAQDSHAKTRTYHSISSLFVRIACMQANFRYKMPARPCRYLPQPNNAMGTNPL